VARNQSDFAKESTERVMDAANSSANWMAQLTEHNLRHGMAAMEGVLTIVRQAADGLGQQASAIREHSITVAEEAIENSAEFGNRIVHLKDPLEWMQAHSEFLSKQARIFADGNRKLGETLIQETGEVANATMRQSRETTRRAASEAAE
jgi:hypothetical protein